MESEHGAFLTSGRHLALSALTDGRQTLAGAEIMIVTKSRCWSYTAVAWRKDFLLIASPCIINTSDPHGPSGLAASFQKAGTDQQSVDRQRSAVSNSRRAMTISAWCRAAQIRTWVVFWHAVAGLRAMIISVRG